MFNTILMTRWKWHNKQSRNVYKVIQQFTNLYWTSEPYTEDVLQTLLYIYTNILCTYYLFKEICLLVGICGLIMNYKILCKRCFSLVLVPTVIFKQNLCFTFLVWCTQSKISRLNVGLLCKFWALEDRYDITTS